MESMDLYGIIGLLLIVIAAIVDIFKGNKGNCGMDWALMGSGLGLIWASWSKARRKS